jgi:hypothetical protein
MNTINVPVTCWKCKEHFVVTCDKDGYDSWKNSEQLIQNALPDLSAGERELLISGTCDNCWHEMFGESVDYDYDDNHEGYGDDDDDEE